MSMTPDDETNMTVEAIDDFRVLITVERGNGDSVQTMDLTTQEWLSLLGLLETFNGNWSPAIHLGFKSFKIPRGIV